MDDLFMPLAQYLISHTICFVGPGFPHIDGPNEATEPIKRLEAVCSSESEAEGNEFISGVGGKLRFCSPFWVGQSIRC